MLEEERVYGRLTRVRRRVSIAAAIAGVSESLAGAAACDAASCATCKQLKVSGTGGVQVNETTGGSATSKDDFLGQDKDRKVVAVDETDVVEVKTAGAVEGELGEGCGRFSAGAGTLDLAGAAVSG